MPQYPVLLTRPAVALYHAAAAPWGPLSSSGGALEAARRRGPARAAPSRRRGQPDPGLITRYFPDNHAAGVQCPRDEGWAWRWVPEPHPRRKSRTNSDPGGGPQAAGGGRERLPTGAEKEASRRLLLVVQQVIFLGWLFYSY